MDGAEIAKKRETGPTFHHAHESPTALHVLATLRAMTNLTYGCTALEAVGTASPNVCVGAIRALSRVLDG